MRTLECALIQRGWRLDDLHGADLSAVMSWGAVVLPPAPSAPAAPQPTAPASPTAPGAGGWQRVVSARWKERLHGSKTGGKT